MKKAVIIVILIGMLFASGCALKTDNNSAEGSSNATDKEIDKNTEENELKSIKIGTYHSSAQTGYLWFYRDKKMYLWKDDAEQVYDSYKIESGKVIASNNKETIELKIIDEKTLEYEDALYFFEEITEYVPKHGLESDSKAEAKTIKIGHYDGDYPYLWISDDNKLHLVQEPAASSVVTYYYEIEGSILYATSGRGTLEFEIVDEETLKLDEEIFRFNEEVYL